MDNPGIYQALAQPDVGDTQLLPYDSGQFLSAEDILLQQELPKRLGGSLLGAEKFGQLFGCD
jgi:hypothetical protein